VKDVVTGLEGICDAVSFDLYGCVQAAFRPPGVNEKGELKESRWYDIKRLSATGEPIMPLPDFALPEIGPADKPSR
jgi:hypothetical protein